MKRSTTCSRSLCGTVPAMMPGAKPTVSTTSVSPSQRPIECPVRPARRSRMARHVHVNRAREAAAVLERDRAVSLRDAVDRAVEHPVEQHARDLAARSRAVVGRLGAQHVGRGLTGRRERHGARAQPAFGTSAIAICPIRLRGPCSSARARRGPRPSAERSSIAPAPNRRRRSARRRGTRRPIAAALRRRRELLIALEGRVVELQRLDVAGRRIVAMRIAGNLRRACPRRTSLRTSPSGVERSPRASRSASAAPCRPPPSRRSTGTRAD